MCVCSVAQECPTLLWPQGLQPTKLLYLWDFPGKNTGVRCHFLLQGNLPDTEIKPGSPALQVDFLPLSHLEALDRGHVCVQVCAKSLQLCPILCDAIDPARLLVHGILQARTWNGLPCPPQDWTCVSYVSCIGRWVLYHYCHLGSPPHTSNSL